MREDAVDSQKGLETILKLFVGDEQVAAALLVCHRRAAATRTVYCSASPSDYNGLSQEDRETEFYRYRDTERRMNERRKYLAERCSEEGLDRPGNDSLHRPNAWEFLVNREHRLIWCNVFKAASTSWMYNFNLLAGYSPQFLKASKAVPVSLARQKYPRPTADELARYLNDSVSFLIVRHPFERLLSAYRDKLEHSLPHTFHSKLGSHIISHYRLKVRIIFISYLYNIKLNARGLIPAEHEIGRQARAALSALRGVREVAALRVEGRQRARHALDAHREFLHPLPSEIQRHRQVRDASR
ncbi:unnamed protein product [Trichogramma brassicae]|uniref:Carbohydrate sulfotransferase n=1 Tax=Trichogramma brassicae TaxID=86971 RepID=A0A6H5HX00_9HYME|nr:unnamed protein product [Trichogramma brassicae]